MIDIIGIIIICAAGYKLVDMGLDAHLRNKERETLKHLHQAREAKKPVTYKSVIFSSGSILSPIKRR